MGVDENLFFFFLFFFFSFFFTLTIEGGKAPNFKKKKYKNKTRRHLIY
jgi:hypothetical protein